MQVKRKLCKQRRKHKYKENKLCKQERRHIKTKLVHKQEIKHTNKRGKHPNEEWKHTN